MVFILFLADSSLDRETEESPLKPGIRDACPTSLGNLVLNKIYFLALSF
jgi:hypothetical protein